MNKFGIALVIAMVMVGLVSAGGKQPPPPPPPPPPAPSDDLYYDGTLPFCLNTLNNVTLYTSPLHTSALVDVRTSVKSYDIGECGGGWCVAYWPSQLTNSNGRVDIPLTNYELTAINVILTVQSSGDQFEQTWYAPNYPHCP